MGWIFFTLQPVTGRHEVTARLGSSSTNYYKCMIHARFINRSCMHAVYLPRPVRLVRPKHSSEEKHEGTQDYNLQYDYPQPEYKTPVQSSSIVLHMYMYVSMPFLLRGRRRAAVRWFHAFHMLHRMQGKSFSFA